MGSRGPSGQPAQWIYQTNSVEDVGQYATVGKPRALEAAGTFCRGAYVELGGESSCLVGSVISKW